jgi:glycosyltransferase involved in cell wall biosynthesis
MLSSVVRPTPGLERQIVIRGIRHEQATVTATDTEGSRTEPVPRVLFVNTRSALGADVAVHLTLIENLNPEQVRVYVATNRHSADLDATRQWIARAPHVRLMVCDLGQEMGGGGVMAKLRGALRNLPALVTLLRLVWLIRREGITVLHTTDRPRDAAFTTLLSKMTGASVVLHLHLKWTADIGGAAKWAVDHARAVIGISKFTCQSMVDGGIPRDRIFLAYNATDSEWFKPGAAPRGAMRKQIGVGEDVPLVGIVGRFTPWKGHLDLVNAFAQVRTAIPAARLVIVGRATDDDAATPGGYVASIRRRINELQLSHAVSWVDWVGDVRGVMTDLDIMAMPSVEEPFGLVATECMCMERPVVGYVSGSLPELITDGVEGRLVKPGDAAALSSALVSLLRDPGIRAAMGSAGRRRVIRDFSPRRQADDVTALYRSLVRGGKVPHSDRVSALAAST